MDDTTVLRDGLIAALSPSAPRHERARRAAVVLRTSGGYRWVGLYDVTSTEIAVIAWDGPGPPTFPRFPRTQGLNGAAVASGRAVVVQDVAQDPRYLTTIGGTRAEMIVPVFGARGGVVVGTIDVESADINVFGPRDDALLHAAAVELRLLWQ